MKIWLKILLTVIAGGLTYLLTNSTGQPEIWQLTMSIFVGGVVLVIQILVDTAELVRRTADGVAELDAANTLLAQGDATLGGHNLRRLVEAASQLDRREEAQLRFADLQVRRLTELIEGLRTGRAEYDGGDRDWLLGLTETAATTIDATSMTSFGRFRGFVDEGQFWSSELGRRYLEAQRRAIERGVQIRRVFLISAKENPDPAQIEALLAPHRKVKIETRVLRSDDLDFLLEGTLADFILFDQQVSYDLHTATSLDEDTPPLIATVALVVNPARVAERRRRFQEIWDAAE